MCHGILVQFRQLQNLPPFWLSFFVVSKLHMIPLSLSPCSSAGLWKLTLPTYRDFCIYSEGLNSANAFPHWATFLPHITLISFFLNPQTPCSFLSQQQSLIPTHKQRCVTFHSFFPFASKRVLSSPTTQPLLPLASSYAGASSLYRTKGLFSIDIR